ncbi:MAG: plastocyanin/azurin family copper-binding protein, partial [Halobacteriaceae archaeon]
MSDRNDSEVSRRAFLKTTVGATAIAGATTSATAQEGPVTVEVGPNGSNKFVPEQVYITPGTTVKWVWKSAGHNIVVGSQPDAANWQGTPGGPGKLYNPPYTYTHTFEVKGKYHYWCQPHKALGMVGDVIVNES